MDPSPSPSFSGRSPTLFLGLGPKTELPRYYFDLHTGTEWDWLPRELFKRALLLNITKLYYILNNPFRMAAVVGVQHGITGISWPHMATLYGMTEIRTFSVYAWVYRATHS